MAEKNNPSIYEARSTIGSSDELDEYGVWVKVAPTDIVDGAEDFPEDMPVAEAALEDVPLEDVSDFIDYSDADADDLDALLDDIQFSEELPEPVPEAIPLQADPREEVPDTGGTPDLSTQLLMKIAEELTSIKGELSDLKSELSVIRRERPAGNADKDGFFEGGDDDKIALTGDELNNILHTADFTEETGTDAGENPDDNFENLVDTPPEEPGEISLEIPASDDVPMVDFQAADISIDIPEDLKALSESGVEPMTPPPEDTSYLEEDPLAEDAPAQIDLEEPSPDTLSLIDFDVMNADTAGDDTVNTEDAPPVEENLFVDMADISIDIPEDTSYLEEDPLVEDAPAQIDLEEPSPDTLSLIDLNVMNADTAGDNTLNTEDTPPVEENIFVDMADISIGIPVDTSYLEEDPLAEDAPAQIDVEEPSPAGDDTLNTEDAPPVEENIFEEVSFDELADSGESIDLSTIEETVAEDTPEETADFPENIEIDLPSPDVPEEGLLAKAEEIDEAGDVPGAGELDIDLGSLHDMALDDLSVDIPAEETADSDMEIPSGIKLELKNVLEYMDKLLESLPEEKIEEFAQSEHYVTYKKLFDELGIE
ncbi:hypothetical protein AGMMS49944_07910 [Spirochaetia bacterium]|nr:hypothetical protein AGMMS49944_07910 [Spirochaetia bacterium]